MKVFCTSCKTKTNHKILSKNKKVFHADEGPFGWSIEWQIIECQGCDLLSGREIRTYEQDFDPRTHEYYEYETLHPKRGENLLQMKNFLNLPIEIRSIYSETIETYNNQNLILCAGGLRALIEGICKEHNIKDGPVVTITASGKKTTRKKDLRGKISGLHEKGLLTKTHADILNEHRFLGNKALHELKKPSTEELQLAIEIIEHTIENIFELTVKADNLRETKSKRK